MSGSSPKRGSSMLHYKDMCLIFTRLHKSAIHSEAARADFSGALSFAYILRLLLIATSYCKIKFMEVYFSCTSHM